MKQFTQEEINILGRIKSPDGKTAMELVLSGRLRAEESDTTVQETTVQKPVIQPPATEPAKPHIYSDPVGVQQMISAQHMIPEDKTQVNNYGGPADTFSYNEKISTGQDPAKKEMSASEFVQAMSFNQKGIIQISEPGVKYAKSSDGYTTAPKRLPSKGHGSLDWFIGMSYLVFAGILILSGINGEDAGDWIQKYTYSWLLIAGLVLGAIRFMYRLSITDGDFVYALTGRRKDETVTTVQPAPAIQRADIPTKTTEMYVDRTGMPPQRYQSATTSSSDTWNSNDTKGLVSFLIGIALVIGIIIAAMNMPDVRHVAGQIWESTFNPSMAYSNRIYFDKYEKGSVNDINWLKNELGTQRWAIYEGVVSDVDYDLFIMGDVNGSDNSWFFAGHYNYQEIPNVLRPGQQVRVYIGYIDGAYDVDGKVFIDAYPAMVEVKGVNGWTTAFNLSMSR